MTAGYSGTPLPKKLGINAGATVLLLGGPTDLDLDVDARFHRRLGRGPYDVIMAFCKDIRQLDARFAPSQKVLTTSGALWICWPKKSSGLVSDLSDSVVREHGLAQGLVDVKVAAIDATWSGLKFVRRLADR